MENISLQGFLLVAGVVFGSVSLLHLVRATNSWRFVLGPMELPMAVSWLGFLITFSLCVWAFWLLIATL